MSIYDDEERKWLVDTPLLTHPDIGTPPGFGRRQGFGSFASGGSQSPPPSKPEPRKPTVKERLEKQRKQNWLEAEKTMAMLQARKAEKKAGKKAVAKAPEKPRTLAQIFAKSAQVPAGSCETGVLCESLAAIGQYGAYAAAVAQGSEELMLSHITGEALATLPDMAMKVIGRAGILAAFVPAKMGDGTLYSEDDIRQRDMIETNIRLRVDDAGHVYGYHVDGDAIPRRTVTASGDKFLVTLEEGLTIEWVPISGDFGGKPILINPIPELESHDIWIHPQADQGKEFDNTYITPVADADLKDYILVFPADTGLPPLYVVFKESPRDEPGVVTGQGEDITGIWLAKAGEELGSPVPSQIADKLRGRRFSNFDRFREAFWIEVSKDAQLSSQFIPANITRMKEGKAPRARFRDTVGGRRSFELHHVEEIQHGGKVYDVDNIKVNTPRNHIDIHKG
ncbi:S-type pyocin domain-containing protein [Vibrio quintilis]|uniref:Pyocin-S2 n=1 Tax=Vibrio quintilis TaxID=1117707 RepID=A0A1M7YPF6_9VIBR|nr:S-type pyocin domain-containing protein [Vibrio quintilis]SHO54492.1 Pyocin-S2 [Vibrio quintilis]